MKLTKKRIEIIEKNTSCSVHETSDKSEFYIYVSNPCDEDYEIEIEKSNHEIEDIIEHCDNYDIDEHFDLWWGAKNGEPQSVRDLLENCEAIGEELEKLAKVCRGLK